MPRPASRLVTRPAREQVEGQVVVHPVVRAQIVRQGSGRRGPCGGQRPRGAATIAVAISGKDGYRYRPGSQRRGAASPTPDTRIPLVDVVDVRVAGVRDGRRTAARDEQDGEAAEAAVVVFTGALCMKSFRPRMKVLPSWSMTICGAFGGGAPALLGSHCGQPTGPTAGDRRGGAPGTAGGAAAPDGGGEPLRPSRRRRRLRRCLRITRDSNGWPPGPSGQRAAPRPDGAGRACWSPSFERVTEAYLTLSDPDHRKLYAAAASWQVEAPAVSRPRRRTAVREGPKLRRRGAVPRAIELLREAVAHTPKADYLALLGLLESRTRSWLHHAEDTCAAPSGRGAKDPSLPAALAEVRRRIRSGDTAESDKAASDSPRGRNHLKREDGMIEGAEKRQAVAPAGPPGPGRRGKSELPRRHARLTARRGDATGKCNRNIPPPPSGGGKGEMVTVRAHRSDGRRRRHGKPHAEQDQ